MAMNVFINYFARATRATSLNLAMARVIICTYGAWKIATYPFADLAGWPAFMFQTNRLARFMPGGIHAGWLVLEQIAIVCCLILVALGWRRSWTIPIGACLLTHLSAINYAVINEKTFLPIVYFLILYGLYRDTDSFTWDRYRESSQRGATELQASLQNPRASAGVKLASLKWFLLTLGLIYFFTGWCKIRIGHIDRFVDWAAPENMRLILEHNALYHIHHVPPLMAWLRNHDWALWPMGLGTLVLELGFVIAILTRRRITLFVFGLAAMHLSIFLTMGLNYLSDMAILYLAFVPWDSLVARLSRDRSLRVVYDGECLFCMRTLLAFKKADQTGGLHFVSSGQLAGYPDLPASLDYDKAMYVFDETGRAHRGYHGFCALMEYFVPLRPLIGALRSRPVAWIGERAYAWVARNRGRISTCRLG
jgi:predicted DCC family thiol-disulfide oxidoreductase YuxK